jgi:transmembrane sensor
MSDSRESDTNLLPDELIAEAASWCARMESDDVSAQDELAFRGWLADDPRRRAAVDAVSQMTMDPALIEAMQVFAGANQVPETAPTRRLPSLVRPRLMVGIGLASILAIWLTWPWLDLALTPQTMVVTLPGQTRTIVLADGSKLELSGGTSLSVRLASARRVVRMQAGEAFFTVAPDASRPFIIETEDGRVKVLGTAFDLSQTRDGLELAVHHGRVAFGSNRLLADPIELRAEERADAKDGFVSTVKHFDLEAGDWRNGWLQTDGITLSGLAERLSRRHDLTVSVDPALADKRIAGRFRLNDPEALLRSLSSIHGFAVTRSDAGLLLTPRG